MKSGAARPLAGLGLFVALALIFALAVGLFRGSFTETVPVTVISDRAGLVMNPDARVKMRGVEVGKVKTIEQRADGTAALQLDIDPSQMHLIPSNVLVDITSSTVFGAKFVQLMPPPDPSPQKLHEGQVIQSQHVTVEINTVFQQLVNLLDKIDPAKLNETLGAIATAFNGRGEKFGQTLVDFNALLAKIEPSLPNLSHDIEASVPTFNAYADAAPDLVSTIKNTTTVSNSIVDQQQNLDEFLVSAIGLADLGNEVVGANRQGLTDVAHLLVPTTGLLAEYHDALRCGLGGLVPFSKVASSVFGDHLVGRSDARRRALSLSGGPAEGRRQERWRQLLRRALGLPDLPANFVPPFVAGDVGSNPAQYGNQGILLNSDALKNWLFGPLDGPPRNTAQIGQPG